MTRTVLGILPYCTISVLAALLLTGWVLSRHTLPTPPTSQTPQAAQTIGAGTLFSVSESGGMALCYARTNLTTLPPVFDAYHLAPVASYGSSYGGSSAMQGANP